MVGGSPFTGSIPEAHKSLTQVRVEKEIDELLDLIVAEDFHSWVPATASGRWAGIRVA